jgi:hypothetical protein
MKTLWKRVLAGLVVALAVTVGADAFAYTDVLGGLEAMPGVKGVPHHMRFSWQAVALHTDVFAATDLGGAGDAYAGGKGGYVVLAAPDPSDGLDATDRIVSYGAGDVTSVAAWVNGAKTEMVVDENIKLGLGNLATKSITSLDFEYDPSKPHIPPTFDTVVSGPAGCVDVHSGLPFLGPATKIVDANNNGQIKFRLDYDFDVVEGGSLYYDRNRDGAVDDSPLLNATVGSLSDRPFAVLYEGGPKLDITNPVPPGDDADGDGVSRVDNAWLGNPFGPVDVAADGTVGRESDPNLDDMSPFATDPLLVGELTGFHMEVAIRLNPAGGLPVEQADQNLQVQSNGYMDLLVTGGRLYEYLAQTLSDANGWTIEPHPDEVLYRGTLNASFKFQLGGNVLTEYEYTDNGTLDLYGPPVPETPGMLLLAGPLAGLALRRRRRS